MICLTYRHDKNDNYLQMCVNERNNFSSSSNISMPTNESFIAINDVKDLIGQVQLSLIFIIPLFISKLV